MGKVKDKLFTDTDMENYHELLGGDPSYEEWLEELNNIPDEKEEERNDE